MVRILADDNIDVPLISAMDDIARNLRRTRWQKALGKFDSETSDSIYDWMMSTIYSRLPLPVDSIRDVLFAHLVDQRFRSKGASSIRDTTSRLLSVYRLQLLDKIKLRELNAAIWLEDKFFVLRQFIDNLEAWRVPGSFSRYIDNDFLNDTKSMQDLKYLLRWKCILQPMHQETRFQLARVNYLSALQSTKEHVLSYIEASALLHELLESSEKPSAYIAASQWYNEYISSVQAVIKIAEVSVAKQSPIVSPAKLSSSIKINLQTKAPLPAIKSAGKKIPSGTKSEPVAKKAVPKHISLAKASAAKPKKLSSATATISGAPIMKPVTKLVPTVAKSIKESPIRTKVIRWEDLVDVKSQGTPMGAFEILMLLAKVVRESKAEGWREEYQHLLQRCMAADPTNYDPYIDLATLYLEDGSIREAIEVYGAYPFPEPDIGINASLLRRPNETEMFVHTELNRLLYKEQMFDDSRFERSLIWEGRGNGIASIGKYIEKLDALNMGKRCMKVYAGVNGRSVEDPDMVGYFKTRYWM